MKILVCGDRNYNNRNKVNEILTHYKTFSYPSHLIIVEGGAQGADTLAKEIGIQLGAQIKEYKAQWGTYGKGAGPIRNKLMLDDNLDIEIVIAFHNDIEHSRGTKNMIKLAEKYHKKVILIQGTQ
jgi:hypothetical protein